MHIINGKPSPIKNTRHGINSANLKAKPEVPVATHDDLDWAVAAGHGAFKTCSRVPYEERPAVIITCADATDELSTGSRDLFISEQGKLVGFSLS